MNEFVRALTEGWGGALHITPFELLVSMVCALACGFIISETYRRTHRGGDYSRSFLQVLILVAIIVAFVTLVVGNDLARAFTLVGALSVVRFRTAVKDARDLGFIFWGVATGMGSGVQLLSITLLATVAIAVVVFILDATNYGSRDPNLKVIRIRIDSKADYETAFAPCFKEYLAEVRRLSVGLVRQGMEYEVVYSARLRDESKEGAFLEGLRKITGDHPVTIASRDQETLF